jgi:hypothetical protein
MKKPQKLRFFSFLFISVFFFCCKNTDEKKLENCSIDLNNYFGTLSMSICNIVHMERLQGLSDTNAFCYRLKYKYNVDTTSVEIKIKRRENGFKGLHFRGKELKGALDLYWSYGFQEIPDFSSLVLDSVSKSDKRIYFAYSEGQKKLAAFDALNEFDLRFLFSNIESIDQCKRLLSEYQWNDFVRN